VSMILVFTGIIIANWRVAGIKSKSIRKEKAF